MPSPRLVPVRLEVPSEMMEQEQVDFLLANSYFMAYDRKHERIEGPFAPLGPLYIASCLRQAGLRPGFFDGTHARGLKDFVRALDEQKPRAVGIYATVISRQIAL